MTDGRPAVSTANEIPPFVVSASKVLKPPPDLEERVVPFVIGNAAKQRFKRFATPNSNPIVDDAYAGAVLPFPSVGDTHRMTRLEGIGNSHQPASKQSAGAQESISDTVCGKFGLDEIVLSPVRVRRYVMLGTRGLAWDR